MNNYIQEGKILSFTASGTLTSGQGYLHGSLFGIIANDAVSGETAQLAVNGVFELAKAAAGWSAGDKLYWDDSAKNITNVPSTNKFIGIAENTVVSGDSYGKVLLVPSGSADLDTIGEIVTALEALTGASKLSSDALKDGSTNHVFTATDDTKLTGIEALADVTDATNVAAAGAFMKGTDTADSVPDGATNKAYTGTEKTKLGNYGPSRLFSVAHVVTFGEAVAGYADVDTGWGAVAVTNSIVQILRSGAIVTLAYVVISWSAGGAGKIRVSSGGTYILTAGDVLCVMATA